MRTELPVFKRCCFCVPLRYGLLTWGYIKLITAIALWILITISLVITIQMMIRYDIHQISDIASLGIILVLALAEVALNILFVVGGHKKNVKLVRIYYMYNLVILGFSILMVLVLFCLVVGNLELDRIISSNVYLLAANFASYFIDIAMQFYFVLLLRSEIIKLSNNCQFQFSNIAAEAECTMKYKERLPEEEEGSEGDCEERTCATKCQINCQTNGTCHKNEEQN